MPRLVEDVFVTEGVPRFTFVPPPNFNELLIDVRRAGKPVIVEGQSGTGKTTSIKKIVEQLGESAGVTYLTARNLPDVGRAEELATTRPSGTFVIDDFHRLPEALQKALADLAKLSAESVGEAAVLPKLVLVGINQIGSDLIQLVPDLAKRVGIHRIQPGTSKDIERLITAGCAELQIAIKRQEVLFDECKGDYWLAQQLCQSICTLNGVMESCEQLTDIAFDVEILRPKVVEKLKAAYYPAAKEFCRGRRFRPSNDPYFKLLRAVGQQDSSVIDLNELANSTPEVRGSINNIKEKRLGALIQSKPVCARYFYYNQETKNFAIEDPALFYFLKHLNWEALRSDCGFRESTRDYEYDFALSFAGANRELARCIAENLEILDARVFFDEYFEANFLGKAWSNEFKRIFGEASRLVVCLLDKNHKERIWPTFERECFQPRVPDGEVIPVYLDDTLFPGIPLDTVGIKFRSEATGEALRDAVISEIVFKLMERIN